MAITTSITRGDDLLLYRTLDLPDDPVQRLLEVQRSVAVAAAYYEDKVSVLPRTLYFAGNGDAAEFEQWFGTSELTIVESCRPAVNGRQRPQCEHEHRRPYRRTGRSSIACA